MPKLVAHAIPQGIGPPRPSLHAKSWHWSADRGQHSAFYVVIHGRVIPDVFTCTVEDTEDPTVSNPWPTIPSGRIMSMIIFKCIPNKSDLAVLI
jgi:hypothetical protein